MGTVGFDNGRKNKIVPRMLLNDCVAVNTASVPKKLRSAMKKRGRESFTPPLPISKKQHHLSNGIVKPRKEGAKKSKLNMKKGRITKDEKEVAETLYTLADLFSDATKANQPGLDDEPPQTLLEDPGNVTSRKKSRKTSSKVIREAAHHSSDLLDSTSQVVVLQSLGDTQQPEVHFSEQPSTSSASGVKPDLSLDPRQKLSSVGITPSCEQAIAVERMVTPSEIQYGKHYHPMEDKSNGLYSFSATGTRISETNRFGFPTRFENTNFASQPRVSENSVSADKNIEAVAKSKKSWKRCAAQAYICRLIKVLQISNKNEGSLEKHTQLAACGGSEPRPHTSTHPQTRVINGRNVSFNGIKHFDGDKISGGIQNETLVHKRALQDQQLASEISVLCTSLKQGENYNFLSLDARDRRLDDNEGINRTGHSHVAPHDSHASYVQLQNQSAMRSSVSNSSFYGHSSDLAAAQQVHFPTYSSSATNSGYTTHFLSQYNSGAKPYLPEWRSEEMGSLSMLYTRALFPHLNSTIGSKFSLP